MSEADVLLDLKKYHLAGIEYVRDGKELNEVLDHVVDVKQNNDEDEETEILVRDLDEQYMAAFFLGIAFALEDILKELPSHKVKQARKKVFHED